MLENLDECVALKVDDLILLDYDNVKNYLKENMYLINNIKYTFHDNYHMNYGYNELNNPIKIAYHDGKIQRIIIKTKDYSSKRVKIDLSYDGSNYHGFQIQTKGKTIQKELSKLVSEVNDKNILVQGASRTDAGVHAYSQTVHFDDDSNLSTDEWLKFLNHRLPKDIYVKKVEFMHPLFHSRYDVYEKEYIYRIKLGSYDPFLVNYSWHQEYLDFVKLEDQIKKIIGTFDFTSFTKCAKGNSIRTIYDAGYKLDDDVLKIYIRGNGFLRYMVRLIVYQVIAFSTNKTSIDILTIIQEKNRLHTKNLAPATGLYLNEIIY
ncbi:MAG: tRNA pseudouridine(38-40) synthase TruA [Candidatus Izemoplasmatales bacterium]